MYWGIKKKIKDMTADAPRLTPTVKVQELRRKSNFAPVKSVCTCGQLFGIDRGVTLKS